MEDFLNYEYNLTIAKEKDKVDPILDSNKLIGDNNEWLYNKNRI